MKIKIFIILLFGVFLSCKNEDKQSQRLPESSSDSPLVLNKLDGSWELFKVNDTLFSIENVYSSDYGGQPRITIETNNNKIGGFTGCNAWGTTLNIVNNSFVLKDPIEKHEQGCGGSWESEFLNFLRNNKSFTLHEDNLKLSSSGNKTMTFRKIVKVEK